MEATRLSGINSANVLTACYVLSGFTAALAGIVSIGRSGICNGTNAIQPYDTDAIASCVLGGASFMGGKGTVLGTMIGALIMVHGDDSGLVLPPKVAPTQLMVIPVQQRKEGVMEKAAELCGRLGKVCRAKLDGSDKSPGW